MLSLSTSAPLQNSSANDHLHEYGDAHFSAASDLGQPMDWVPDTHDVVFPKHVHHAFTDTSLEAGLRKRGIGRDAWDRVRKRLASRIQRRFNHSMIRR